MLLQLLNDSNARPLPTGSTLHDHGQLLPLAESLGLGVIGVRNLSGGALSSGLDREVDPESLIGMDSRRAETLRFLETGGVPLSRWSAKFALQQSSISTVVPGVKNVAELADQIVAIELDDLSAEQLARIEALRETDFGLPQPDDRVF